MSTLTYLDQSAANLRLTLLTGEVDTDQFHILTGETRRYFDGLDIEAAIIGSSHFVCLRYEGRALWEVFACTDVEGEALTTFAPPQPHGGDVELATPEFTYTFHANRLEWEAGSHIVEEIERGIESPQENHLGLAFHFPTGPDGLTPKTLVLIRPHSGVIPIDTIHSYPNEGRIVHTHSEIRKRRPL